MFSQCKKLYNQIQQFFVIQYFQETLQQISKMSDSQFEDISSFQSNRKLQIQVQLKNQEIYRLTKERDQFRQKIIVNAQDKDRYMKNMFDRDHSIKTMTEDILMLSKLAMSNDKEKVSLKKQLIQCQKTSSDQIKKNIQQHSNLIQKNEKTLSELSELKMGFRSLEMLAKQLQRQNFEKNQQLLKQTQNPKRQSLNYLINPDQYTVLKQKLGQSQIRYQCLQQEFSDYNKKLQAKIIQLAQCKQQINLYKKQINQLQCKINQNLRQISKFQNQSIQFQQQTIQYKNEIQQCKSSIIQYKNQIREYKKLIDELKSQFEQKINQFGNKQKLDDQKIKETNMKIQQNKINFNNLIKQNNKLQSDIKIYQSNTQKYEWKIVKLNQTVNQKEDLVNKLVNQYQEIKQSMKNLKSINIQLESTIKEHEISMIKQSIRIQQENIPLLAQNKHNQRLKKANMQLQQLVEDLSKQLQQKNRQNIDLQKYIKQLVKQIEQLTQKNNKHVLSIKQLRLQNDQSIKKINQLILRQKQAQNNLHSLEVQYEKEILILHEQIKNIQEQKKKKANDCDIEKQIMEKLEQFKQQLSENLKLQKMDQNQQNEYKDFFFQQLQDKIIERLTDRKRLLNNKEKKQGNKKVKKQGNKKAQRIDPAPYF